nr:hypothetical protein Itr_chr03CG21070 [Ipomoea trifida]
MPGLPRLIPRDIWSLYTLVSAAICPILGDNDLTGLVILKAMMSRIEWSWAKGRSGIGRGIYPHHKPRPLTLFEQETSSMGVIQPPDLIN